MSILIQISLKKPKTNQIYKCKNRFLKQKYFFPTKKYTEENTESKKPEHPSDVLLSHPMIYTTGLQLYS